MNKHPVPEQFLFTELPDEPAANLRFNRQKDDFLLQPKNNTSSARKDFK